MNGILKPSALKKKLKYLESIGLISIRIENGRQRKITYNHRQISERLASLSDPSKSDPSKSDPSKSDGYPSKSDGSTRQKVTGTRQKVATTNLLSNPFTNPSPNTQTEGTIVCEEKSFAQNERQDSTALETELEAIAVRAEVIPPHPSTEEAEYSGWSAKGEIIPQAAPTEKFNFQRWIDVYKREKPDCWADPLKTSALEIELSRFDKQAKRDGHDGLRLIRLALLEIRLRPAIYAEPNSKFKKRNLSRLIRPATMDSDSLVYTKAEQALSNNITDQLLEKLALADVSDTELRRQVQEYQTSSNTAVASVRANRAERKKQARLAEMEKAIAADKAAKGYWEKTAVSS